ncbi:MAG TPA: inorganic pyrophosphatase Ppa [Desulfobacterales bacterium]|nr:inorganic pyrophosphatase Ppa [Desulfobacterales bacterium]
MPITTLLKGAEKLEIEAYKKPRDLKQLGRTHVPFSGAPQKHPYDSEKIILVIDPYSSNTFYYEFRAEDISYVEELPNIVNLEGKAITMARIWVKKMSIGLRSTPFIVQDTIILQKASS